MDDDFDELLGGPSAPPEDAYDSESDYALGGVKIKPSMTEAGALLVQRGATPGWFASILGIGRTTVNRKLADIAPKRVLGNGTKMYSVREALPYLVQPHDLKHHLARMNPKDLPERLRKEFWSARKLEQDVRVRSKDLWQTADVHRVLGDLMKLVKDTAMLWTDDIDEATGLTSEQVGILDALTRKLLSDFAGAVAQYVESGVTPSQESEFDEGDDEA
jgi:hypothetical protein